MALPTLMPTVPLAPAELPAPAPAEPPADSGWLVAAPGAELRRLRAELGDGRAAQLRMVRLDPAQISFRVGYAPDAPLALAAWAAESEALAVINGGFFEADGSTVALLVSGGQTFGSSYVGRGAFFTVGPDGAVGLRSLADAPYDPAEPLAEALQGWPLLVRDGAAAYGFEDGERARRSALAIDSAGRVLLIAVASSSFTLAELSTWLAASDLGLVSAVNLDGGSSTGLILQGDEQSERVESFVPLPIVLIAARR